MTPSQRLAEQLEELGRCEVCGRYLPQSELIDILRGTTFVCCDCYVDPPYTEVL